MFNVLVFSFVGRTLRFIILHAYKFWLTSGTLKFCSVHVELNNLYSEKQKRNLKGLIF